MIRLVCGLVMVVAAAIGPQEAPLERARRLLQEGKTPEIPELYIIADKATPYRLLFSVIVSSRSDDAGYRRFRLIVLDAREAAFTSGS